jgi:protein-disulfide isomerase-like protein with CxxC motif
MTEKDKQLVAHKIIHKTGRYEWKRPLTVVERAELLAEAQEYKRSSRRLSNAAENYKANAKEAKEDSETARRAAYAALDKLEEGSTVEIIEECILDLDYTDGRAAYTPPVTGELLHTRELSKEEMQMSFDFGRVDAPPMEGSGEAPEFPARH